MIRASTSSANSPWNQSREIGKESTPTDAIQDQVKALWSSKSNKTASPSENLLEGLTDDLAVVPFTIPEEKLEEPPAAPAPMVSRMSSQDVARAFQQVPTSSGNATAKVNGPSSSHQPPRQTALPMANTMPPPGVRAAYPNYPSPMMSSPSPTLGYPPAMTPSPVPRPMVASSPHYAQPMWVPVPPPPNGPPGMMRPMASPYGHQLMPYPPAGSIPMYMPPPPTGGAPPHHPNGTHGRPPTVMMSPVPPQAQAAPHHMYATSPVMMPAHAIPGMPPPGTPYSGPATQGRAPAPPQRGAYDSVQGMMQPSASFGSQAPAAYPYPLPNSYARTPW